MSTERVRLLTLMRPAMGILPEVTNPERKVNFKRHLPILTLSVFFMCSLFLKKRWFGLVLLCSCTWSAVRFQFTVCIEQLVLILSIGWELFLLPTEVHLWSWVSLLLSPLRWLCSCLLEQSSWMWIWASRKIVRCSMERKNVIEYSNSKYLTTFN